jgi:hypothetical protein
LENSFYIWTQEQGTIEADALCRLKGAKCDGTLGIHLDLRIRTTLTGRAPSSLTPLYYSRVPTRLVPFLSIPIRRRPLSSSSSFLYSSLNYLSSKGAGVGDLGIRPTLLPNFSVKPFPKVCSHYFL